MPHVIQVHRFWKGDGKIDLRYLVYNPSRYSLFRLLCRGNVRPATNYPFISERPLMNERNDLDESIQTAFCGYLLSR